MKRTTITLAILALAMTLGRAATINPPSGLVAYVPQAPVTIPVLRVCLQWTDNSRNESGFIVERAPYNAEFIIRAVNSHDALLAACQCACAAIAQYQAIGRKCDREALDVVFAKCESAIALETGVVDEMKPSAPEFYRKLDALATGNQIAKPTVIENLNQPLTTNPWPAHIPAHDEYERKWSK